MFTVDQKRRILYFSKRLNLVKSKKEKHQSSIKQLKSHLLEHGLTEKPLAELSYMLKEKNDPYLKWLAAWELARWYANMRNKEGAFRCLEYLDMVLDYSQSEEDQRQTAIMRAECYELLGEVERAKQVINKALASISHPDLFLAASNLEDNLPERIRWINRAMQISGIEAVSLDNSPELSPYDRLSTGFLREKNRNTKKNYPMVTVIIPTYNSSGVLPTALNSILGQTWTNLEVLVVDDCSADNTKTVVKKYIEEDPRVKLLSTPVNSGPYVARNIALGQASGDLVTTNDADDWSHPQKLEIQVKHLLDNSEIIANLSQQVRATSKLKFYRRGRYGNLISYNTSSLMFWRGPVMEKLGYWDSVRFGSDNEYLRRIRKVFGDESLALLQNAPLSFQRQSEDSLTGSGNFGYHGHYMGARKEYLESQEHFHHTADSFYYPFPQKMRPFPVPEPMWPEREKKPGGYRRFDTVLVSDFRFEADELEANIREIERFKDMGLRVGLVQMYRYDYKAVKKVSPSVRGLIDGDKVQILVYGEKIECDHLIVLHPPVLEDEHRYLPELKTGAVSIVLDRDPIRDGEELSGYNIKQISQVVEKYFGCFGVWYPSDQAMRKALINLEEGQSGKILIADKNWPESAGGQIGLA